jgi:hypothetical protein
MPTAIEIRTSEWGSAIPSSVIQDFIVAGVRHDALADFAYEYIFEALDSVDRPPADLGDALRVAFTEIIQAATGEDWRAAGEALVAGARDCLGEPEILAPTDTQPALAQRPRPRVARPRRWRYRQDGVQAKARRETASRLIEAYQHLCRQNPDARVTLEQIVLRADVSRETMYAQFGRTAGLRWAADAETAIELPALWCDVGLAELGTPAERIRAVAHEYVRLLLTYPGPMRTLLDPHELDDLLRPKDPSSYRSLVERRDTLAQLVAEQDRLLEGAIGEAAARSPEIDLAAMTRALTASWLRIATHVWAHRTEPDAPRLLQKVADSTNAIFRELSPSTASPS